MLKKKWFWMMVMVLAAASVAAWLFGGGDSSDETTPVFTVAEGPLTIGITASGSVQSRDKVVLRSELEGRNTILWVVEDGVSVKTSTRVFRCATGNRTRDTRIFSPLLYQLSYGTRISLRTTPSFDWDCKGRYFFLTCKFF